uniref:Uncharacterized protein n=1 Tax=Eptatretus burgeri TaxID=7764 RepID=A0A8C4QKH0_EPTBU
MSLPKGRSPPASQVRAGISQAQIPRGPSPQTRDDRIHASAVSTVVPVYSTVTRQPGPPSAPYGTVHEMNKSAQALPPSQPPHAHSPGLSQHPYVSNQPGPPPLVYPTAPPPQQPPMNAQPQQSRQFPTGARPTHHQVLTTACLVSMDVLDPVSMSLHLAIIYAHVFYLSHPPHPPPPPSITPPINILFYALLVYTAFAS